MTLSKLKTTEQILLAMVIIALTVGTYTFFRFIPKNDAIAKLHRQTEKTQSKLLDADIPNEPEQEVEELLKELDEKERTLALTKSMADKVSQRLAPFDSQELKVRISELATSSGVHIKTNEAFRPSTFSKPNKLKPKAKTKASPNPSNLILPVNRSWIERLSSQSVFHRPLQRLVLDGDYHAIRTFIYGLEKLQWQVTPVRASIELLPISPLRGHPQRLKAELVLAL
jgi:hypothetical protein